MKTIMSITATIIAFGAFYPYIKSIQSGKISPSVFSWIIWGITTSIVFLGQVVGKGGIGTLSIGFSALITFYIAFLAWKLHADIAIHRSDWLFFGFAVLSIIIWVATSNPLYAIIVMTITDLLGYGPTLRKSYQAPFTESPWFFLMIGLRNILAIMAMESVNLTTILFPTTTSATCFLVFIFIIARRFIVARTVEPENETNTFKQVFFDK